MEKTIYKTIYEENGEYFYKSRDGSHGTKLNQDQELMAMILKKLCDIEKKLKHRKKQ